MKERSPILGTCVICGAQTVRTKRGKVPQVCGEACRKERFNRWQRERNYARSLESAAGKKKCGICGKWYRKVGSHVFNAHGTTAREYREWMGLPVKKGILADDAREMMREHFYSNQDKVGKNLVVGGKPYRFKKGDERTKSSGGYQHPGSKLKEKFDPQYY